SWGVGAGRCAAAAAGASRTAAVAPDASAGAAWAGAPFPGLPLEDRAAPSGAAVAVVRAGKARDISLSGKTHGKGASVSAGRLRRFAAIDFVMPSPSRLGGIIHSYQRYDPAQFPSPTQPPPDVA